MSCAPGNRPGRRRSRDGTTERRRLCDAHHGAAPAVATIRLEQPGTPIQHVAVCASHLALFEAAIGGLGPPGEGPAD